MADIATLGYRVDSTQLDRAAKSLDKTTAAAGRTSSATKKMESDFARVGKLLVQLGIAYKAGQLVGIFIRNTIDASREQAQLAAVLKSTGGAAGQSQVQLNKMADAMQQVSTFAAGSVTEMQSVLLTFTKIQGDVFPKAQQAVLDMATALKMDLQGAAIQVGKALNDPILGVSALGRAGVQFSADQKKMIESLVETGRVADAQVIILKELETQFGGSALAARNTLGGALTVLKNNFNDLLEGDSGSDGVRGTVDAINDLAETLSDPRVKKGFADIASGVASVTAELVRGIALLTEWFTKAKEAANLADGSTATKDASYDALLTRQGVVGQQRRRVMEEQRTTFLGFDIPGAEKEKQQALARLDKERVDIQRELTRRIQAERWEGVTASVGGGRELSKPSPKPGSGDGSKAANKLAREAEKAAQAMRDAMEAQAGWHDRVLDMSADLGGPTAQVMRDYDKSMQELTGQFNEGKVRLDDYAVAQELLTQIRDKDLAAIRAQKTPAEEMLEALRLETESLYLSNEQLEIRNNLLSAGVSAGSVEAKQITAATEALQQQREVMREQIEVMDSIRDAGKGLVVDLGNGVKPIDAIGEAWDRVHQKILNMIAENLMDQLFGKQGEQAGGSAGGWFSTIMGLIGGFSGGGGAYTGASTAGGDFGAFNPNVSGFGGGRAYGGDVRGDWAYQTGERNRPELLNMGGKQYLIPGDRGNVEPMGAGGGVSIGPTTNKIYVQGNMTNSTTRQMNIKQGQRQRMAAARFGS